MCDLAETYGIFNYKELPLKLLATLVFGLRDNSRTRMRLSSVCLDSNQILLVSILDALRTLVWLNSSSGMSGENRPESLLNTLLYPLEEGSGFESSATFEEYRNNLILKINERRTNGN